MKIATDYLQCHTSDDSSARWIHWWTCPNSLSMKIGKFDTLTDWLLFISTAKVFCMGEDNDNRHKRSQTEHSGSIRSSRRFHNWFHHFLFIRRPSIRTNSVHILPYYHHLRRTLWPFDTFRASMWEWTHLKVLNSPGKYQIAINRTIENLIRSCLINWMSKVRFLWESSQRKQTRGLEMAVALQCNRLPLSHNASSSCLSWEQLRASKPVNYKACCNVSQYRSLGGRKRRRGTCAEEVDNLALRAHGGQRSVETPRDDVIWQNSGSKSCCYSCLCCICS